MNIHYDPNHLTATAFRIKEMGDGFLCLVDFPFKTPRTSTIESIAYRLAGEFVRVFAAEVDSYFRSKHYTCGIGIAKGEVEGFFPSSGTREYDLFGDGIIHATRYESMRKHLASPDLSKNIIILQESVYEGLSAEEQADLIEVDLKKAKLSVRDDSTATKIYFKTDTWSFFLQNQGKNLSFR